MKTDSDKARPYRLCAVDEKGAFAGLVSPRFLQFETEEEGETIAARYRLKYPEQRFAVRLLSN